MNKKRRSYTEAFKLEALELLEGSGKSAVQAARGLPTSPTPRTA